MKYIEKQSSKSRKIHYCFAFGLEEAKILSACLRNAFNNTPKLLETTQLRARIKSMIHSVEDNLDKFPESKS